MSIKSTQNITRAEAINRIRQIVILVYECNYKAIADVSYEPDHNVWNFVNNFTHRDYASLDKWSDRMLEEVMDEPFFRYSMFDNYLIK